MQTLSRQSTSSETVFANKHVCFSPCVREGSLQLDKVGPSSSTCLHPGTVIRDLFHVTLKMDSIQVCIMSSFSEVLEATLPPYVVFSVVLVFWSVPPIPLAIHCFFFLPQHRVPGTVVYSFDISAEITAFSPLLTHTCSCAFPPGGAVGHYPYSISPLASVL